MYVRLTHLTYYKRINTRVNAWLVLLLYVCVAHTHEPNPLFTGIQGFQRINRWNSFTFKLTPFLISKWLSWDSVVTSMSYYDHNTHNIMNKCDTILVFPIGVIPSVLSCLISRKAIVTIIGNNSFISSFLSRFCVLCHIICQNFIFLMLFWACQGMDFFLFCMNLHHSVVHCCMFARPPLFLVHPG